MKTVRCIACGIVWEMAFLVSLALVWRTESVFAAIGIGVLTGLLLSWWLMRSPAFRPVKDSLLWLAAALAAHLLADWMGLPLYIVRLCDVGIRETGSFSAADGLSVLMVPAVFAVGALGGYAVALGWAVRQRNR